MKKICEGKNHGSIISGKS